MELYNPNSTDVNLQTWKLTRKASTGTESNLVASLSGTIKAHGFFLITPQTGYLGLTPPDRTFSVAGSPIVSDNTILLYGPSGTTLIDKVGWGSAVDREGTAAANPLVGEGLERKANSSSTIDSMANGDDKLLGNGEDTDNNTNDFIR